MSLAVEVGDLWKSYGEMYVLRGVELRVGAGEFISVRGRSGVGKSTLLRIIGLLDRPDRGVLKLFGRDVLNLDDEVASSLRLRSIGFIFQSHNLIPWLTVRENVELPMALAKVKGSEMENRAHRLLGLFGLEGLADRYPGDLSWGEQQRVAVVRALANGPRLILADEPTSSLDPENSRQVVEMLSEACRGFGASVIFATVDIYESLPSIMDYIIRDGRLEPLNLKT